MRWREPEAPPELLEAVELAELDHGRLGTWGEKTSERADIALISALDLCRDMLVSRAGSVDQELRPWSGRPLTLEESHAPCTDWD